jgi:hypothetical protein
MRPIIETSEFLGRVEATSRVDIVARVAAASVCQRILLPIWSVRR